MPGYCHGSSRPNDLPPVCTRADGLPEPFRFLRELKGEMQDHLGWRFPVSFYRKVLQPPAVTDAFLLALFFLGGVPIHSPTGLWTKKTANSRTSSRNNM